MILVLSSSCVTHRRKPCTEGGQSAREPATVFRGTKRCYQDLDKSGHLVNHGKYYEWYVSDKLALEGEYKEGKKTGRWIEYDETGKKISDKHYLDGKEIPAP
jgi:hypothetical protein